MKATQRFLAAGVLVLGAIAGRPPSAATEPAAQADRLRQSEVKQQMIRTQTGKVSEMLGFLVNEFERNGIGGDDVQILKAIQSVLGGLTDKEMHLVIGLLQEARSAGDPLAARKSVVNAYSGQKNIIVQLRQVLLEYQRRIALYEISLRLEQLAVRQDGNMKTTVRLAKETDNRKVQDYNEGQKSTLQVQQIEEQSLKEETRLVVSRLETIAKESDAATAERLKEALQKAKDGQLEPSLATAVEDLAGGNLFRAANSEKTARDELRRLSRLVAPPKDLVDALRQALKDLDKAIAQQDKLNKETKEKPRQDEQQQMAELEERQAELVDKTDLIREEIQNIAPQPASQLK
jgi:signal recognition particle subunit SEC65